MNDIKKLIQKLKEHQKPYIGHDYIFYEIKFCNPQVQMCIEALEKQIPKKVKQYNDKSIFIHEGVFYCPSCQENVSMDDVYCCQCGQSLDWEVENE